MIFLVLARDRPGALEMRLAHRGRHLEYWQGLPGVVKVAGAMIAGDVAEGSAFLIEADDEEAVRKLIAADPFATEGIFGPDVQVQAVRPAIGSWLPG
ncbi:MAG: hypothetical protein JWL66_2574 [Sphingomonadales bacterium]|nr:hypothetical protein [Sphingomonadales bacterium]